MASFLNQKEQVLSVELTKHGRKLLGTGYFKPVYFEFFDDSVIYDTRYASSSFTEEANLIQNRILNETINTKALNLLTETLENPLGSSDIFNDYAPSWNLLVLNGKLDRITGESNYSKNVFESTSSYELSLTQNNNPSLINYSSFQIDNEKTLQIIDDYLLIDLKEENVSDDYKNFEIEVFVYDELNGGLEGDLERQLKFIEKQANIIDGYIYDEEELPDRFSNFKISLDDVDHYLDILVDDEIDRDIITVKGKTIEEMVKGTYTTAFEGTTKKEDC